MRNLMDFTGRRRQAEVLEALIRAAFDELRDSACREARAAAAEQFKALHAARSREKVLSMERAQGISSAQG